MNGKPKRFELRRLIVTLSLGLLLQLAPQVWRRTAQRAVPPYSTTWTYRGALVQTSGQPPPVDP